MRGKYHEWAGYRRQSISCHSGEEQSRTTLQGGGVRFPMSERCCVNDQTPNRGATDLSHEQVPGLPRTHNWSARSKNRSARSIFVGRVQPPGGPSSDGSVRPVAILRYLQCHCADADVQYCVRRAWYANERPSSLRAPPGRPAPHRAAGSRDHLSQWIVSLLAYRYAVSRPSSGRCDEHPCP